jgi:hypothetical protein
VFVIEGPFIVPVAFFLSTAFVVVGLPIARALSRKMERDTGQPRIPSEVSQRLERMEHAIDTIAVEVERISEGQRFVTKLLADRPAARPELPASTAERQ